MSDQSIHDKWTEFITDPKYSKYFLKNQPKKDMSKPIIKPKQEKSEESPQIKRQRHKS